VTTQQRLIVAPTVLPNNRLAADLTTLQADPSSEDGKRYLAEAEALFGPGSVPVAAESPPKPATTDPGSTAIDARLLLVPVLAGIGLCGVVIALARRRRVER
jgi:hypothetical protein